MTKNILIATDNFLPRWDGVSRFLNEVIPGIAEDYDVTVIAPDYGEVDADGYDLIKISLSRYSIGDYTLPSLFNSEVKEEVKKADIIFAQTIGPIGSNAIRKGSKYDKNVVSYIHNIEWELIPLATGNAIAKKYLGWLIKLYARYHYNKCDKLIIPAKIIGRKLEWYGVETDKVTAQLGVNTNVFNPLEEKSEEEQKRIEERKHELGLNDEIIIGTHGRLAREKDIKTLLRSFKWLKKKRSDVKLVIIGDGLEEISSMIQEEDGAIWIPRSDTVQRELSLMDIYVTCSLTETTSLSTLEAMSTGLAVVSTPVGYVKEYIRDGYNGLTFHFKDSYELYQNIKLLCDDDKKRRLYGKRARKKVMEEFRWDRTTEKIKKALKDLNK